MLLNERIRPSLNAQKYRANVNLRSYLYIASRNSLDTLKIQSEYLSLAFTAGNYYRLAPNNCTFIFWLIVEQLVAMDIWVNFNLVYGIIFLCDATLSAITQTTINYALSLSLFSVFSLTLNVTLEYDQGTLELSATDSFSCANVLYK